MNFKNGLKNFLFILFKFYYLSIRFGLYFNGKLDLIYYYKLIIDINILTYDGDEYFASNDQINATVANLEHTKNIFYAMYNTQQEFSQ